MDDGEILGRLDRLHGVLSEVRDILKAANPTSTPRTAAEHQTLTYEQAFGRNCAHPGCAKKALYFINGTEYRCADHIGTPPAVDESKAFSPLD